MACFREASLEVLGVGISLLAAAGMWLLHSIPVAK